MPATQSSRVNRPLPFSREEHLLQPMGDGFDTEAGEFGDSLAFATHVHGTCQAETALHAADNSQSEFLATLAHELRNPLASASNALQLLNLPGCPEETARMARAIMDRQLRQITRLVEDVLDISRFAQGKIQLRKECVNVASILETAIETSRPIIDAAGHELTIALPRLPLLLVADPTRLAQVFSNLISNSAKYTAPNGRIRIAAARQGGDVVVSVRDNGAGLSGEALSYIFDMFRQVDRSREQSQGGLGIGLTLVRRLVELHGGSITAQSDGEGKGSTFTVRLPACPT